MLTTARPASVAPGSPQTAMFSILSEDDDLVLHVRGTLDSSMAPDVRKRLGIMRDLTGGGRLIVDLRDTLHLDPAVLDALRTVATRCRTNAVDFLIRNPSPTVAAALHEHR
jgi:anti-anti-sigma factor